MSKIVAFLKNESGATAIEYGLIAAGISVAIIAVVNGLGSKLNTNFTSISTQLKQEAAGNGGFFFLRQRPDSAGCAVADSAPAGRASRQPRLSSARRTATSIGVRGSEPSAATSRVLSSCNGSRQR
jgi:pilus assembly protein Flp/PilA